MLASSSAVKAQPRRVLLVEDDGHVRMALDRQLRVLGWEVIAVGTGREAIRIVESGTRVAVLLTDLDLPDIDGGAVARAVTTADPATRVVFMSGGSRPNSLVPPDATFLRKPFSHGALAAALER